MKFLKHVSDKDLVGRLRILVEKEKKITLEILPFLAEVDRRELYLSWGCGSLTDYCISHLGYCESSAWRRVRAARVVKDFPEVYDKLVQGRLTFSAVILASRVLRQQNKTELLARLCGKSQGEIKKIIAEYEGPQIIHDQARPRLVAKTLQPVLPAPNSKVSAGQGADNRASKELGEIPLRSEGKKLTSDENSTPRNPAFKKMYEIRFAADEELMELMKWMRSYLSGRCPDGAGFLEIFKCALAYVREREDLARRAERKKEKRMSSENKKAEVGVGVQTEKSSRRARVSKKPRHIPIKVREKVWSRDGGRCAFVGSNGRRCNSTFNLQFDHHPVPFARGGPNTANNLRLLCARHNRYAAGQVYGKTHMELFRVPARTFIARDASSPRERL